MGVFAGARTSWHGAEGATSSDGTRGTEYWLDLGAGMDAEHWCATPCPPGVCRVALDPLITTGMIDSGRLAVLPPDVLRVGAEIRPPRSVERERQPSFLPFREGTFRRIHCGYMLHLYLETLDLLANETHRVLQTGGELTVLLPHFGTVESERTLQRTEDALRRAYEEVRVARFEGPFTTFWADLYRDKSYRLVAGKGI